MTTKEYLQQISRLDKVINNKLIELTQLKEMSYSISAISTGDKVKYTPNCDPIGTTQVKIIEMEQKIDNLIDKYVDTKKEVINEIESMEDENTYHILFSKYIAKKTFEDIAVDINKSWRQTIRLHGIALQRFEDKYGEKYL